MQIQINAADIESSQAIQQYVHDNVEKHLGHHEQHITRVEVHLRDDNAGKSGSNDKRCVVEVRIANAQPLAVESTGEDMYGTINDAIAKAGRATKNKIDRG